MNYRTRKVIADPPFVLDWETGQIEIEIEKYYWSEEGVQFILEDPSTNRLLRSVVLRRLSRDYLPTERTDIQQWKSAWDKYRLEEGEDAQPFLPFFK